MSSFGDFGDETGLWPRSLISLPRLRRVDVPAKIPIDCGPLPGLLLIPEAVLVLNHPAFNSPPKFGQFAQNGEWETAWSFTTQNLPMPNEIERYLAGATEVAFEAFFGDAFFGVRKSSEIQSVALFASACVDALRQATNCTSFISLLSEKTSLSGWGNVTSFAEVGVVNAWKSSDSFKIPALNEALDQFDAMWTRLDSTSLSMESFQRKAVEFVYLDPLPHWFALPVSSPQPPYGLSKEKLHHALKSALSESAPVDQSF